MLATLADAPLTGRSLVYEPKYDGIRALVEVDAARPKRPARPHLVAQRQREDRRSFPRSSRPSRPSRDGSSDRSFSTARSSRSTSAAVPAGFQRLQGRMHLTGAARRRARDKRPASGVHRVRHPARRQRRLCAPAARRERRDASRSAVRSHLPRQGEAGHDSAERAGRGRRPALHARALKEQWEGLIAKDAASVYQAGRRSPAWRKIKLVHEQEFVVGGWTEPRQTRQHFGALLLGVYDGGALDYVGHTGTGFDQKELARVWSAAEGARDREVAVRRRRSRPTSRAHWVRPDLVAQIKFTEWTDDGKLRHPVYLGLRDDKSAKEVVKEGAGATDRSGARRDGRAPAKRWPQGRARSAAGARGRAQGRRDRAAQRRSAQGHQPREALLARPRRSPRAICSATTSRSRR